MLNAILSWSLHNRFLVLAAWAGVAVAGVFALRVLPIDAFPDTTPVQVQVNTIAPALSAKEIERQITFPVEQAISGLPGLKEVRSTSKYGLSQVVVTFEDGTDILKARTLINERLGAVELPAGVPRPKLGPIATGLGEVLHYAVVRADRSAPVALLGGGAAALLVGLPERDLMELRTVHDWTIKPVLRTVPGTAEINSWGGLEQQFQVRVDPEKLVKYGVTFRQIQDALQASNINVGGGTIRERGEGISVRGVGQTPNVEKIGRIVVESAHGTPVLLRHVADVKVGAEIRRGAVTVDGKGEAVLGLGFMLMGENSHDVTRRLTTRLDEVEKTLPPGVAVVKLYDRTELVDHVIGTVRNNLFEGGLLVIAVLFVFLGNLRAGLIVAAAIPIAMLCAFLGMNRFAIAGSLLSLGAIDFGLVVDSSVVLVENVVRHLAHGDNTRDKRDIVLDAAVEVRKPTLFGELIILIVYLPILTLDGVAGKMFRPMALTVIFALLGSLLASLTLIPVLASIFLSRKVKEAEPLPVRAAEAAVLPLLRGALAFRAATIGLALAGLAVALFMARGRGGEFIPVLSEGAITMNIKRLAGVDVQEVVRRNTLMEQGLLKKFPDEIEHVWSRCGVAEVATDPMGVEETDTFIALRPRSQWTVKDEKGQKVETQRDLMRLIRAEVDGQPGQVMAISQPIEQRVNEMTSGVKGDVAIKVFGDDFEELSRISSEIERVLKSINPRAEVTVEQLIGAPTLEIELNLAEMAKLNLTARTVLDYVEALGSKPAGDVLTEQFRFPLIIRLSERWRDKAQVAAIPLPLPGGGVVPLGRVTTIRQREGPATISREWGRRRTVVQCNIEDADIAGFVAEARKRIDREVRLPQDGRYRVEFGGTYEHLESANRRLMIVIPVALLLIFGLLYMTFHNFRDVFRVYTGVPFAVIGGVVALQLRDMPFSVPAAVGFIALLGVSVLNSLLLVTFIRQMRDAGMPLKRALTEAVRVRMRPVLMTALVASLGFLPMALSTGMGAEVQRPLATVVIGGVVSSTVMTLLVLPAVYRLFGRD
jgi:cobalt-zinc-cadmium resistance protein CzcA